MDTWVVRKPCIIKRDDVVVAKRYEQRMAAMT